MKATAVHAVVRTSCALALLMPLDRNAASGAEPGTEPTLPVPIIFDTDIQGDVDDVGAVAVLHALADRGEAKILAMGVCVENVHSSVCLDALNTYFGRGDVPLGVLKGPGFLKRSRYAEQVAREFPHRLASADDAPDAVAVYRRALAEQPDASVVLVSVGPLTNVDNLLRSKPDAASRLEGRALVAEKVRLWVCMGGTIPLGREANVRRDPRASAHAVEHWPTPIVFSGSEIGDRIGTGARLSTLPKSSPVRRAYELYNGLENRWSWDQTAVLYAVRGHAGGLADVWDLQTTGSMAVDPADGTSRWRAEPQRRHAYLVEEMPPEQVARMIEDLMLHQPADSRN